MSSWVRYCVAVYVGLLLSGALAHPRWTLDQRYEGGVSPDQRDATIPLKPAPHEQWLPSEADEAPDLAVEAPSSATLAV